MSCAKVSREGEEEGVWWVIPVKFSRSSRLVKSTARELWLFPRDDIKRVEVSGVRRLSVVPEGVGWRGREGAEWGSRPPLAIHTPLWRTGHYYMTSVCLCVCEHL